MDMKQPADVSRFMLFEATGDSEADCDSPMMMDDQVDNNDDDNDDAESCSYDGSENQNCNLQGDQQHHHGCGSCELDYDEHHDAEKKKDEGEACGSYGISYCDDDDDVDVDEIIQKRHKSILSVDSGQHLMDEMEKNRRFWEACLAS